MIIKILEDPSNSGHEKEHLTLLLSNIQEKIQELGLPRGSLAIGAGNDINFANYINHDCLYYQSFNHKGTSMHIQYIALGFRGTRLNFSKKLFFCIYYTETFQNLCPQNVNLKYLRVWITFIVKKKLAKQLKMG